MYKKGDKVIVDEVEYEISGPAEAYLALDAEGNEFILSLDQIESGMESAKDPEEKPDFKSMSASERKAYVAQLAKELGA